MTLLRIYYFPKVCIFVAHYPSHLNINIKSSHHSSKSSASRTSRRRSKSGESKIRAMEEKANELLVEKSFPIKRQIVENDAKRLKVQEMVTKAKARAKVIEESESGY